jgi:hypothetical protein
MRDTGCQVFRGFPLLLHASSGILARLDHNHFLPNPFQFISHPTIRCWQRRSANKQTWFFVWGWRFTHCLSSSCVSSSVDSWDKLRIVTDHCVKGEASHVQNLKLIECQSVVIQSNASRTGFLSGERCCGGCIWRHKYQLRRHFGGGYIYHGTFFFFTFSVTKMTGKENFSRREENSEVTPLGQNRNVTFHFIWVWNLVFCPKRI